MALRADFHADDLLHLLLGPDLYPQADLSQLVILQRCSQPMADQCLQPHGIQLQRCAECRVQLQQKYDLPCVGMAEEAVMQLAQQFRQCCAVPEQVRPDGKPPAREVKRRGRHVIGLDMSMGMGWAMLSCKAVVGYAHHAGWP
jgi:hypothetical protein